MLLAQKNGKQFRIYRIACIHGHGQNLFQDNDLYHDICCQNRRFVRGSPVKSRFPGSNSFNQNKTLNLPIRTQAPGFFQIHLRNHQKLAFFFGYSRKKILQHNGPYYFSHEEGRSTTGLEKASQGQGLALVHNFTFIHTVVL